MIDWVYIAYITKLAKEKRNEEFYNSNSEHAKIVLSAILENASQEVNVCCANLCSDVTNSHEYLTALKAFFEKGGVMNILLFAYNELGLIRSEIYKLFLLYSRQVIIKYTSRRITYENKEVHFTVADGIAFRFETDIKNKKARGNFNNPSEGKVLNEVFWDNFTKPESISVHIG